MRLSIRTKLFLMFFSVIVMVSGSIGSYFYFNARTALMTSLQQRLQSSAALIARNIRASDLAGIDSDAAIKTPAYQYHLGQLREWVHSNADLAYIYLMRLRASGDVIFVVDSDESSEQAKPGQVYTEVNDRLLDGFERPSVDDAITSDEWGYFLTGYAPVQGGRGEYLVGVDMRADEVQGKFRRLHLSGLVSLILSVILAWVFSALFSRQFLRPVHALIGHCREIADGHYGERIELATRDELDTLIGSFNRMSEALRRDTETIEQTRAELERQQREMEAQIQRRLSDLTELNSQLMQENKSLRQREAELLSRFNQDEATGLMNRRGAMELLDDLRSQAQRGGRPFSLIRLNLDFAESEDVSMAVQAEILRREARNLETLLRDGDTLSRFGDREFLVILPLTGENIAERMAIDAAERLGVQDSLSQSGVRLQFTRYFGVAEFRLGESLHNLLERAGLTLPK